MTLKDVHMIVIMKLNPSKGGFCQSLYLLQLLSYKCVRYFYHFFLLITGFVIRITHQGFMTNKFSKLQSKDALLQFFPPYSVFNCHAISHLPFLMTH